ncbi:hypothetical protein [Streptomyces sp. NPDC047097]|uniref:hypothetical protein n=1 Tax=Streptomyces sp. NPDC047097 TaxID=3155260 RepID=UPI00340508F2
MQLPVGGRAALGLGRPGHRVVHGGRDLVTLGAAVGLPVLAARAVPAGVEQHPVVAPGIAALLTLGQAPGQQPAHRVGVRATGAQLLVQAPHEPVGEHLRSVCTARRRNARPCPPEEGQPISRMRADQTLDRDASGERARRGVQVPADLGVGAVDEAGGEIVALAGRGHRGVVRDDVHGLRSPDGRPGQAAVQLAVQILLLGSGGHVAVPLPQARPLRP